MKSIIVALLLITLAPTAVLAQAPQKPITIQGYTLGEKIDIDCDAAAVQTGRFQLPVQRSGKEFDKWRAACEHGDLEQDDLIYRAGKLVSMKFTFTTVDRVSPAQLLADTIKKFGRPTDSHRSRYQNGFGAVWDDVYYFWNRPGFHAALYLYGDPTDDLVGILQVMTPKMDAEELELYKRKGPLE